jgi:hypothetical protein
MTEHDNPKHVDNQDCKPASSPSAASLSEMLYGDLGDHAISGLCVVLSDNEDSIHQDDDVQDDVDLVADEDTNLTQGPSVAEEPVNVVERTSNNISVACPGYDESLSITVTAPTPSSDKSFEFELGVSTNIHQTHHITEPDLMASQDVVKEDGASSNNDFVYHPWFKWSVRQTYQRTSRSYTYANPQLSLS